MIVCRIRIIYNSDTDFFDVFLKFKDTESMLKTKKEIERGLNLYEMDFYKVKKNEFSDYFKDFKGKYNKKNTYYLILLSR